MSATSQIAPSTLIRPSNTAKTTSRALVLLMLACLSAGHSSAQKKLPTAEKIIDNYIKAIGGKRSISGIRDATYDFVVQLKDQSIGTARVERKSPASQRWEMTFGNGQIVTAANTSSAWEKGLDGLPHTLTGPESANAKLHALLDASRLLNFKKLNLLARVVSVSDAGSQPAYIVEFSTRGGGARLRYYFNVKSGLLTKITDDVKKSRTIFEDYRAQNGMLESHRIRIGAGDGELVLLLQSAKYNTGIEDKVFDPPAATESLDVAKLLQEVGKNQDEIEKHVAEYSFLQKETDRELNDKGELKKETVRVYEIFPLPNREPVQKLMSENGATLSGDRAAKEDKRVQEEFAKAERNKEKDAEEAAKRRTEREKKNRKEGNDENDDPEISQFLKICEFVSPRREQLGGRETIVFDFRPRAGFRPSNRGESLIAKLVGAVWIDPIDKQVIRIEARLADGFKVGGGLLVSLKPGAAFVMEQTRMSEGVWLPRFAQINFSVKVMVFGGVDMNKTLQWSDYRHFSGDVKDYKIDPVKPNP